MNIKYLLVFCLGAVTGSVFTAKFLDERYSKIADEEIESVKEVAKKTIDDLKGKISNIKKAEVEAMPTLKVNDSDVHIYEDVTTAYNKKDELQVIIEEITEEEYSEDDNEKMTVWFYGQDKALINDDDQPIENVFDCVGSDIIDNPELYFDIPKKTTVYLRNNVMNIDFEIIYLDKSYSKDILGLEE